MKIELDVSDELLTTYTLLRNQLDAEKLRHATLRKELDNCFSSLQRIRTELHTCLRVAFDENRRLGKKVGDAEPAPVPGVPLSYQT